MLLTILMVFTMMPLTIFSFGADASAPALPADKTYEEGTTVNVADVPTLDGGATFFPVYGNSHLEVEHGTEVIIKARDMVGDPFTFYVNGTKMDPDENGLSRNQ